MKTDQSENAVYTLKEGSQGSVIEALSAHAHTILRTTLIIQIKHSCGWSTDMQGLHLQQCVVPLVSSLSLLRLVLPPDLQLLSAALHLLLQLCSPP